jgi:hypothetical protein
MSATATNHVDLVKHVGDSDVEVIAANITYEQALAAMRGARKLDYPDDLDMVSVETGRFVSWAIA